MHLVQRSQTECGSFCYFAITHAFNCIQNQFRGCRMAYYWCLKEKHSLSCLLDVILLYLKIMHLKTAFSNAECFGVATLELTRWSLCIRFRCYLCCDHVQFVCGWVFTSIYGMCSLADYHIPFVIILSFRQFSFILNTNVAPNESSPLAWYEQTEQ